MRVILFLVLLCAVLACSGPVTLPPTVESYSSGGGGAQTTTPCPGTSSADDATGLGNFDASMDVALGIGTVNPTTPPDGSAAFNGDATVAPATTVDAGASATPCR